jgi:hypothetical protein
MERSEKQPIQPLENLFAASGCRLLVFSSIPWFFMKKARASRAG